MYYYLSIGTNIDPEFNAVAIVKNLINEFGGLYLFPFVKTEPVNICSFNYFLNSICVMQSNLDTESVKEITNRIEVQLGRKRFDLLSGQKDREADIDIIISSDSPIEFRNLKVEEPYVNAVLSSEFLQRVDLKLFGLPSIYSPSSINFDTRTGQIVVVDDKFSRFYKTFKSPF